MVYQPAPNVAEVRMQMDLNDQLVENTFHVHNSAAWTPTTLQALADTFSSWWSTTAKPLIGTPCKLMNIRVTDLTSLDTPIVDASLGAGVVATGAASLPANDTLAVKAEVNKRGRGRSGRIFWPAIPSDQVVGSEANGAYVTLVLAALNTLRDLVAGTSGQYLVTLHRILDGVKLAVATWDIIARYQAKDNHMDSQRNRLPFHRKASKRHLPA